MARKVKESIVPGTPENTLPKAKEEEEAVDAEKYRSIVGKIMYSLCSINIATLGLDCTFLKASSWVRHSVEIVPGHRSLDISKYFFSLHRRTYPMNIYKYIA
jgi:hypothetical protein